MNRRHPLPTRTLHGISLPFEKLDEFVPVFSLNFYGAVFYCTPATTKLFAFFCNIFHFIWRKRQSGDDGHTFSLSPLRLPAYANYTIRFGAFGILLVAADTGCLRTITFGAHTAVGRGIDEVAHNSNNRCYKVHLLPEQPVQVAQ